MDKEAEGKGVGHRVVMELLSSYFGKKDWVFVDNFYSSPTLFIALLKCDTGTVKPTRKGFPAALKSQTTMEVGSYQFATSGDLVAVCWQDRRDVYMLTTAHYCYETSER